MGIAELFDRIYIVNLPERTDRRREMEDQLVKVGLGGHPRVMFFPAIRPNAAGEFPSIGARGCFSSHLAILQDAAQQGLQRILILEDDLDFSRDFNARIGALCARLQQSDWGVFYGGYELLQPLAGPDAEIQSMAAEAAVRTTHFIAFQAPVMERAAAYLQAMLARPGGHPDGGPMHVDGAYSWFRRQHPEMLTLIAVPELGYQRSSKTDIHPLSWIDRTPLLRDAANLARKLKNHLRSSRA